MKKIALSLAVFISFTSYSLAFTSPGMPTGYVNDYTNTLTEGTKKILEEELRSFSASTTNEIAVAIIGSLDGDTIENYAVKLFEAWKIGNAKNDNGVLLLIAKNDHKLRIEVGYGLEGALPDVLAKDIIDTRITPSFKQGDYDTGVLLGVRAIEEVTKGEYVQVSKKSNGFSLNGNMIELIIIFFIFIFQFLAAILGRSKSWWLGGLLGGLAGGVFTYLHIFGATLVVGSIVTVVLVFLGLLFDYVVSSGYKNAVNSGSSIPWWSGGGIGSGHSSSSSFGGFGGGSSGGGGASGSW